MPKVLVVDDSRLTRRLICGAVESAGHEVVEAVNGEEGFAAFQRESPDFVFSDLLMPVMDGIELSTKIREIDQEVPLVVATADIQDSSRQRCEEIGVTGLMNKPITPGDITDALKEHMDASAAARSGS